MTIDVFVNREFVASFVSMADATRFVYRHDADMHSDTTVDPDDFPSYDYHIIEVD